MNCNPVGWFEIYVQDMRRAQAFYEAVFDIRLETLPLPPGPDGENWQDNMEMLAFPMTEQGYGAPGALVRMDEVPSGAGGTLVYFSCEDCAVEAERAASQGGQVFRAKLSIGEYGFMALVTDTEGNMIGLHSRQ